MAAQPVAMATGPSPQGSLTPPRERRKSPTELGGPEVIYEPRPIPDRQLMQNGSKIRRHSY